MSKIKFGSWLAAAFALAMLFGAGPGWAVTSNVSVINTPPGTNSITLEFHEQGSTTNVATATVVPGQTARVDTGDRRNLCVRTTTRNADGRTETRDICGGWLWNSGADAAIDFGGNQVVAMSGGFPPLVTGLPGQVVIDVFGSFSMARAEGINHPSFDTTLSNNNDLNNFGLGGQVRVFGPDDFLIDQNSPVRPFFVIGGHGNFGPQDTVLARRLHPGNGNDTFIRAKNHGGGHAGVGLALRRAETKCARPANRAFFDTDCISGGAWIGGNVRRITVDTETNESAGGGINNRTSNTSTVIGPSGGLFVTMPVPGTRVSAFLGYEIHGVGNPDAGDIFTGVGQYGNTLDMGIEQIFRVGGSIPIN